MTSCFYNILESFTGNKVNILSNFPDIISQNQPENLKKNITTTEMGQHLINFSQMKGIHIINRNPRHAPRVNAINGRMIVIVMVIVRLRPMSMNFRR